MSKFLGPIHYWVYNKIQIQQGIVEEIIGLYGEQDSNASEVLNRHYGVSQTSPLEEIIDESNIHGWLQTNVTRAEYKLADSVTTLLKKDPDNFKSIESIFFNKGKALSQDNMTAAIAYKIISDSLLDGMPCDHANVLIEENDEHVIWKRNTCVHTNFWQEVGGDINVYYALREALIQGFLENSRLVYEKTDEATNVIRRENR
ncbi:MAG: hypothetical protein HY818_08130 [Acetobacterium woodii]|nr:hypothetical protein [Acetobacterium woodii]